MSSSWYAIYDLDEFIDNTRKLVFKFFGDKKDSLISDIDTDIDILLKEFSIDEINELNDILSIDESTTIVKSIVRKQYSKTLKRVRYIIDDKNFMKILEELNSRMVSNILNKLVNKGVLDSAFDDEYNDFVFWLKEDNNDKEQKL